MPDSATRLFLRFRDRRDGRALARLFDRAAPELLAVAVHLAPDVASAEDLVQATFVAAIEGAGRFDAAREVKPWLFGILAREAAKARRRAARVVDPVLGLRDDIEPSPLDSSATHEVHELVKQALARLSEHDRAVLVPYLTEGLSAVEIARRTGSVAGPSAAHVRVRIGRGIARLRAILPRGLALGAVVVAAPRGHAAVRAAVLQRAGVDAPIGVAGLVIVSSLGAVALSKSLAFVSVAAVALFVWTSSRGEDVPHSPSIATDTTLEAALLEVPTEANAAGAPIGARTNVITAVESTAPSGAAPPPVAASKVNVRGRVVDAEGRPVPGARLVLSDTGDAERGGNIGDPTDANGEFDLAGEFLAGQVRACHPEHVTSTSAVIAPGEYLELRMHGPAARLVVHVTDKEGDPVAGATVRGRSWPLETGVTDEAGRAELAGLEPGWSPIALRALGFIDVDTRVALEAGTEKLVEFSLDRGRRVVGRVELVGGARLEDVRVSINWDTLAHSRYFPGVDAGPHGAFELGGIPYSVGTRPYGVRVVAYAQGFVTAILDLPDEGGPLETVWNPVLAPHRAIEGHVVDEHGVGLAGWRVRLHELETEWDLLQQRDFLHFWTDEVRTDDRGSFSLQRPSDAGGHLSVWTPNAPAYARPTVIARDVAAGTLDLELRVTGEARATGAVRGRVVCNTDGEALEVQLVVRRLGASMGFYGSVSEDGGFELEQLAPGRYELQIVVAKVANVARLEIAVEANEVVELDDVRVPDRGRVRIALVGPDTPPRGTLSWRLTCRATGKGHVAQDGAPPETTTLPGGEYELSIEASHYYSAPVSFHVVPNGETALDVTLEPATLATFRFVAADGGALEYPLQVVVIDQKGGHELARREVTSAAPVVIDIDPGACRIEATDSGGRRGTVSAGTFTGRHVRRGLVFGVALIK